MLGFWPIPPRIKEKPKSISLEMTDKTRIMMYFMTNAPEIPDWYKDISECWFGPRLRGLIEQREIMPQKDFAFHRAELEAERYFEWQKYYAQQQYKRLINI